MRCICATGNCASGTMADCEKCPFAVPETRLPTADIADVKTHIANSYRRFLEAGKRARSWEDPILDFLRQ